MSSKNSSRVDLVFTLCFLVILGVALGTSANRTICGSATTKPATQPATSQPTTRSAAEKISTLQQALIEARKTHKAIYLEFTAPWCTFCKKYEQEVLSTPQGREVLTAAVYLQMNFDDHRDLAKRFGVSGIPTGLLLKPQGDCLKVIGRHVGALSAEELREFLGRKKS